MAEARQVSVFILRRVLQALFVALAMSVIVFFGVHVVGDPLEVMVSPDCAQECREAAAKALGLDRPIWEQYGLFLRNAATGDLGRSFMNGEPVIRLVLERMPATLELAISAMLIAVAFGVVALFLSAIGIYGVLAYGVTQRRREIGIRMALGSTRGQIFGLVLGDGARIVGIGVALGLAGAYFVGKAMEKQLFQVAPSDPWVIATVIVTLSAIALIAVVIPARRAARVNPTVTLNQM